MSEKREKEDQGGRFEECVNKMCANKKYTRRDVLQQFGGYCLLPDCRYQKALILYGPGSTGKSTALSGFEAVIGKDNILYLDMADLGKRFALANLERKFLLIMRNMDTKSEEDLAIFKGLIAGDMVTGERKYKKPFQFRPRAKIIIETNGIPLWPSGSHAGFRDRFIVLKFERQFNQQEADPTLPEKLAEEKDGIFTWMIAGQKELLANGYFVLPRHVKISTNAFVDAIIDKSLAAKK